MALKLHFFNFHQNFLNFFLVKDLTNRVLFLQAQSFWEHTFLARMRHLKNGWPLSAPPRVCFYHPQLLKKHFGKSWHQTAFAKIKFEKFWWQLKEYKPYPYPAGTFGPPFHPLGLKMTSKNNFGLIVIKAGQSNQQKKGNFSQRVPIFHGCLWLKSKPNAFMFLQAFEVRKAGLSALKCWNSVTWEE